MILPLLFAAALKWFESYSFGVNAVRAKNYDVAAEALAKSIAEMPAENGSLRAGNQIITYVPHFWLGIAKFNQGDVEAALREWRISEEQGVVQNTQYYAQLRDWVARANVEKQRRAENAASGSKREANAAVAKALSAQMEAVAAGADRSDAYRAAHRKLQEAHDTNAKGGTDIRTFKRAADLAGQAREMFSAAAEEAKKQKAARAAAPPPQRPQPKVIEVTVPVAEARIEPTPPPAPAPVVPVPQPAAPEPAPVVESEASVAARIAAQTEKRKQVEVKTKVAVVDVRPQLEAAYRAFAAGQLAASEQQLTRLIAISASAEAYLLRGCARYTQAILTRGSLDGAAADFRAALKMNNALRLDRSAFSPKLVAYFDSISSIQRR
jgi:hypothetical protein